VSRRERTPEEREADRREREARRAEREGRAPVDFAESAPPPPVELPAPPEPPTEVTPPEPPPAYEEPPAAPPEPPAAPPEPPPAYTEPAHDPHATEEYDPFGGEPEPFAEPQAFDESAPPIDRRSARRRRQDSASAFMERHGLFADDGRGGRSIGGRRRYLVPALVGVAAVIGLWFLFSLFQPFKGDGGERVAVTIPRGAGVGDIADLLHDRGVISSGFFFNLRATVSGDRGDLKPGTFELRKDMSYGAALDALTNGPPPNIVKLTIPEGRSRSEVDRLVGNQLKGDYMALTRSSPLLNPRRYGAKNAKNLEGFLFPATYTLKKGQSTQALVDQQLKTFKRQFATVNTRFAKSKNLTDYDILTIASMVEREAQLARERPIIASVIYNRLKAGIPLGIDATIRFATNNWTRPLTQSQLAIQSPYNTRLTKNLPPGPIGSPGLSAIKAAARPASTGYLFYVVKPGGCGEHAFSKTDAEFQQDVERYNSERAKRGGKSPTNC
jgi:uncharacterized YceG family protein